MELAFDLMVSNDYIYGEDGWAFVKDMDSKNSKIFFVLISNDKSYIFETGAMSRDRMLTLFSGEIQ